MSRVDDIARDIAAERAALDQNLSMLGQRLTVENIAGEVKTQALGTAEEWVQPMIDRVAANIRQRPLPSALLGVGLAWLMSKPAAGPDRATFYRPAGLYNGPKPALGDPQLETRVYGEAPHAAAADAHVPVVGADLVESVSDAVDAGAAKLMEVRRQVEDMTARIAEGTEDMSEEARARVVAVRRRAIAAIDTKRETARRATQHGVGFVRENPALVGGLALAAGAAIAGAMMLRRSSDDTDEAEFRSLRQRAFDDADRVYSEERARLYPATDTENCDMDIPDTGTMAQINH